MRVSAQRESGAVRRAHTHPPCTLAVSQDRIKHILRVFDFDPQYGPALGLTRLERWERARNLGDDPPHEIREILQTKQGTLLPEYRECVLAGLGV